jgi:putative Holliday junction resolvase
MKLLGVDYGRRRIGIAVTDPTGTIVRGLTTLERREPSETESRLATVIEEQSPGKIVFGVPLGPDDEETAMSREVRAAAERVAARTGIPVDFVDESFSSRDAEILLRPRKKKRRRDKGTIDRIAACLILQSYQREHPCDASPRSF